MGQANTEVGHAGIKVAPAKRKYVKAARPLSTEELARLCQPEDKSAALSELELAAVAATHAFQRWISFSMTATPLSDLAIMDMLVLHQVNQRASNKRLSDICFILNIEDTHVVAYALRKLVAQGIIKPSKHGKEVTYSTTLLGQEYLSNYEQIREHCFLSCTDTLKLDPQALQEVALFLRKMSGLYDQAARAASSI